MQDMQKGKQESKNAALLVKCVQMEHTSIAQVNDPQREEDSASQRSIVMHSILQSVVQPIKKTSTLQQVTF